jgi:hypothetical protein
VTARPIPALKVEVAFTTDPNGPNADTPAWVDITRRVRSIPTLDRAKRTQELDRFEAGTMTLVLDNRDGLFSPVNATSQYAGYLVPYRMIRLTAVWAGVTYPVWQGYVERWPQNWLDPARGISQIQCVDAMAVAAQIPMSSVYTAEVLKDSPLQYYPCTDSSDATQVSNESATDQPAAIFLGSKGAATSQATYSFGGQLDIVGAEAQSGITLTPDETGSLYQGYLLSLPPCYLNWATGWTIECWLQVGSDVAHDMTLMNLLDSQWGQYGYVQLYSGRTVAGATVPYTPGNITIQIPEGTGGPLNLAANLHDGNLHHVVVVCTLGTITVYVDGAVDTTISTSSTFASTFQHILQIGGNATWQLGGNSNGGLFATGAFGQIAVYTAALTADRVAAHHTVGLQAFYGDLTDARADRLLDQASWPVSLRDVPAGRSFMQGAVGVAGKTLLDCLQDIADTENGTLATTATGELAQYGRMNRMSQTAPVIVFGSNPAAGEIPYRLDSLQLDFDPTQVYNDLTLTRNSGATVRITNPTSILAYFARTFDRTLYNALDGATTYAAQWLADRYAQPVLRAETITIDAASLDPVSVPNLWPQLLSLDLHDRVQLIHRPLNAPPITLDGYVDQLTPGPVDPDAGTWTWTIQISPALRNYWILADANDHTWDAFSVLDSTTRLAY